ncbi:serine/threonine-protein kinase [Streptomyces sp. MMBL 11-3]|uniref:serine/threonine-protein kinase n=1 Tax=Streptomyces sp. MMBL 11-3 TaxID=3382639 RepID=UPI0039B4B5D5
MAEEATDREANRIIADRYLLLHRIAAGGGASVWLAYDQRLGVEVALKEILPPGLIETEQETEDRISRIRIESKRAAPLRGHPHVVTVHEVFEHARRPWAVMEYIQGAVSLNEIVLQRGPLLIQDVARIGLATLDALTAGHERSIVHGEVKPSNVLIAPGHSGAGNPRVLLTDYGTSAQTNDSGTQYTEMHFLASTPGYVAPERTMGHPQTAAADLFSLGCTLYFAVEGHGPFDSETALGTLAAIALEEPHEFLRAGILSPLIQALLAKDPEQRPSAEEVENGLSQILLTPYEDTLTEHELSTQSLWSSTPATKRHVHQNARHRSLHPFSPSIGQAAGAVFKNTHQPPRAMTTIATFHRGFRPPYDRQRHLLRDNFLIMLASATATASLLAQTGSWWGTPLLGVLWAELTLIGVIHLRQGESHAEETESTDLTGITRHGSPRRATAFLDGFVDVLLFMHPRSRTPRAKRTRDEYLRDVYNRIGPPPTARPESGERQASCIQVECPEEPDGGHSTPGDST